MRNPNVSKTESTKDVDGSLLQEVDMLTTEHWTLDTSCCSMAMPKAVLKIGGWNVTTMNQTGKWKK